VKNYLAKKLWSISFWPLIFLIIIWSVFLYGYATDANQAVYGVLPRTAEGLKGILLSIFIHGNLEHIASNSLPLLILGMMLFFWYKRIAKPVFLWIWLISGIWLWIGGGSSATHPSYHIGASTLIYGLATFLFFSGVFRRHLRLMVVSALVVFLYGSIMWGIFPLKEGISWEGHLFGAIAGLLTAFNYRKEGPQQRKFDWEEEKDEDIGQDLSPEQENNSDRITVNYIYKQKDGDVI
jgi:membrane associated rhomboid family serine protease